MSTVENKDIVVVAKIGAAHGIQGFNRIQSFTDPIENILNYQGLSYRHKGEIKTLEIDKSKLDAKGIVVQFKDILDRTAAQRLTGIELFIQRSALPELSKDEYYWADLEKCLVKTLEGEELGNVAYLYEAPMHDNLVVVKEKKETHLPFIHDDVIHSVDLSAKEIIVDWSVSE